MKRIVVVGLLVLCGVAVVWWLQYPTVSPVPAPARTPISATRDGASKLGPLALPMSDRMTTRDAHTEDIPDLAEACEEMRARAGRAGPKYSRWFLKHYPAESSVLERYFSPESRYALKPSDAGGPQGASTVHAPGYEGVEDVTLRRQAERGDLTAAGLLGARMSANGGYGAFDAAHLARLREAEEWLVMAIRGGEPDLWQYYAMARSDEIAWRRVDEIRTLKQKEAAMPKAEFDAQFRALQEAQAQERDWGMEVRAINEFSRPYQSPSDHVALAMQIRAIEMFRPASGVTPEDDPRLLSRIDALKAAFKDARLYSLSDVQREEMNEADHALKTVEGVAVKLEAACVRIGVYSMKENR